MPDGTKSKATGKKTPKDKNSSGTSAKGGESKEKTKSNTKAAATAASGDATALPLDSHYAALDLGSNSFHLIVATENNGRLQVVDKIKEMVRLGDGLSQNSNIDDAVAQRALDCLARYAERLRAIPQQNIRAVGTNALREAKNAKSFLKQAAATLGHKIEIISGREEARLIYLGVAHAVEDEHDQRLVVDIGGGSTELVLGRRFEPMLMESLDIGCVSLSGQAFADGKLNNTNFKKATQLALQELEPITTAYRDQGWGVALGASGTILSAASVARALNPGEAFTGITQKHLDQMVAQMVKADGIDELSLPGLASERAPVFAGGIAILQAVLQALDITSMNTSQGALREGLLHDLLGRRSQHDTRERTVEDLMRRYHVDVKHARRVRETSIELLAQVAQPWSLTEPEHRLSLGWSALLHELGMDISHSQYHKHGAYLLQNMDMPGFSHAEQQDLALLVRAHRRKFPKDEIQEAAADAKCTRFLAVLLRVAVLLHRARTGASLPHLDATADKQSLKLSLPKAWLEEHPLTDLDLAQECVYQKANDFALTIDVKD